MIERNAKRRREARREILELACSLERLAPTAETAAVRDAHHAAARILFRFMAQEELGVTNTGILPEDGTPRGPVCDPKEHRTAEGLGECRICNPDGSETLRRLLAETNESLGECSGVTSTGDSLSIRQRGEGQFLIVRAYLDRDRAVTKTRFA